MKRFLTIICATLVCLSAFAQTWTGGVKGAVVSRNGRAPIYGASIQLSQNGTVISEVTSAQDGTFFIGDLADGMYDMAVKAPDFLDLKVFVTVDRGYVKDLIFVSMTPAQVLEDIDESNFAEFDLQDSGYSDAPTILYGGDVFSNVVGYGFSAIRYKTRGYDSETQDTYFSGVKLNDAITGYSPFSLWSGLNEASRAKDTSFGMESSSFGLGGVNGMTNILGNASNVRPGWRFSLLTNSALYRLRAMGTYASGKRDDGWSYAANVSARVGGNDWVKGQYYRSFAYYLAAEKEFGYHTLSLSTFATPGERGAQNASTQEVYDLMGDNMYNSNWGYQNGKVRNSRVRKTFEPVTTLKYSYKPGTKFKGEAVLLWRTGMNGYTALDWYDASDPRPDYYRNLPSYSYMEDEDFGRNSEAKAELAREMWNPNIKDYANYQHLDWDRLYNVNYNSANGRSKYVQEERHVDQNDIHLALAGHYDDSSLHLDGGLQLRYNRTHNYKKLADLLGGEYFLNVDNFAERDYAATAAKTQNDLDYWLQNGQAEQITKGGIYGYNYLSFVQDGYLWGKADWTLGGLKLGAGATVGYNSFWREGLYRKGLFAGSYEDGSDIIVDGVNLTEASNGQTSKGKSEVSSFLTYSAKFNAQYSFGNGQAVYANVGYFNDAPTFNNSFISPRTRNTLVDDLTTKKTFAADVNYLFNTPAISGRVTAYYTTIKDQTDVMSFYDDTQNSFTNFAMTGIGQRHMGVELGVKVPTPVQNLSAIAVVAYGQNIYIGTPHMKQTVDNNATTVRDEDVPYWSQHPIYSKVEVEGQTVYEQDLDNNYVVDHYQKHYVPSSPQLAIDLGLKYNYNYWFFEAHGQFFGKSYLDMNPLYRTAFACSGPDGIETPSEVEYMAAQEAFDPQFLLNFSIGKSWYYQRKYQYGFSLSANNVLNDTWVKTGGYEQTRLIKGSDRTRYYRFDSKYFYMQGANYMLNLYFRF